MKKTQAHYIRTKAPTWGDSNEKHFPRDKRMQRPHANTSKVGNPRPSPQLPCSKKQTSSTTQADELAGEDCDCGEVTGVEFAVTYGTALLSFGSRKTDCATCHDPDILRI